MKTIIVYESTHHGNTKKLVDAIAENYHVETVSVENAAAVDFSGYDAVGVASGVAFGKLYAQTEQFVKNTLPEGMPVFFIFTCGSFSKRYTQHAIKSAGAKGCRILGTYGCLGYDTFGPFKLVGGVAKGHPDAEEIQGALTFFSNLKM